MLSSVIKTYISHLYYTGLYQHLSTVRYVYYMLFTIVQHLLFAMPLEAI